MKRGQVISFRLPSDTPDHVLKYLQNLKKLENRNFSKKIAELLIKGINSSDSDGVMIPVTEKLTKDQKEWLKHEQSIALLRNILLAEPAQITPKVEIAKPIEDDDLSSFEWVSSTENVVVETVETEEEDDLLGGFLSRMNQ